VSGATSEHGIKILRGLVAERYLRSNTRTGVPVGRIRQVQVDQEDEEDRRGSRRRERPIERIGRWTDEMTLGSIAALA